MNKPKPKKNIEMLEMAVAALREFAPSAKFGGIPLSDFEASVEVCETDRENLVKHENAGKGLIITRDNDDAAALAKRELIVNGVIGDPNFGPNSALYEALGYVRKDDRRSGLTRKKKKSEE